MGKIVILFIAEFLEGLSETIGSSLLNIASIALYPEKEMTKLGFTGFEEASKIFVLAGISLLVFKFLKKIFEIYGLGTEGDPDSEPIVLVINFFKAMAISLTFYEVYEWAANIIEILTEKTINSIGLSMATVDLSNLIVDIMSKGLFVSIFVLIYMVFYLAFSIKFLQTGLQVLVLRTGLPLACGGLMDADRGVFRTYMQKFLQIGFTILLQVVLAKLSLSFVFSGHLLWGFASVLFALKTPRFLQEFLVVSEGGNGFNTAYSGVRIAQAIKSFVK